MKAITVRGIPDAVVDRIQQLADANGSSLKKTVIDLLVKAVDLPCKKRKVHRDLDHLIGCWTANDAKEFQAALTDQRTIDPEVWR